MRGAAGVIGGERDLGQPGWVAFFVSGVDSRPGIRRTDVRGHERSPPHVAKSRSSDFWHPAGLPGGAYRRPQNLRTRADLRARTRKNGSENTTLEMLPYRS